jgi:hypothetical protein
MLNYYDGLKEIRELKSRKQFIQYNDYLNGSYAFKQLTAAEQICLKLELYDKFKERGYRDSKNFSYLIVTKR